MITALVLLFMISCGVMLAAGVVVWWFASWAEEKWGERR